MPMNTTFGVVCWMPKRLWLNNAVYVGSIIAVLNNDVDTDTPH